MIYTGEHPNHAKALKPLPTPICANLPSMLATLCAYEDHFGPRHPQTLYLMVNVAFACYRAGEHLRGRILLERVVVEFARYLDPNHC